MPKENKNTNRRDRRQCPSVDNEAASSGERGQTKSVIGSNRYSPFVRESLRRDSGMEKQIVSVPSIEALHSISGGIIESGIKYIMFPLHLLRFCIFGMAAGSVDSEKRGEARPAKKDETRDKKRDEKSTKEREEKSAKGKEEKSKKDVDTSKDKSRESRRSSKSKEDSSTSKESSKLEDKNEESIDDMVTAEEDSDSSMEHWSNATCTLPTASMDYDNIERSMSHAIATEPMDISMEEQSHEKSYTATKTSRDVESKSSRLHAEERGSNSSVDEEIARIFQKQCTSSEDEVASDRCKPFVAHKRERTRQTNFLCNEKSNYSRSKEQQDNDRERTKKPSSDVAQHKRRKVTREEDRHERREEKHGSRHDTPSKHKSRSSRTPVKSKESKQRDTKYKETATQTDSAFSDDDVEMIPIDVKLADKLFCCKHAARRSLSNHLQSKEVEQELNYIADNEDSADGFKRVARKRISSCSTSSSSTDLGFDERVSATLETLSDNAFRICSRAPPGFPELPQNPPLTSSQQFVAVVALKDNYSPVVQTAANVPRAPSPMRHLYYNYPEFMDLPVNVESSRILKNILRNNYYR